MPDSLNKDRWRALRQRLQRFEQDLADDFAASPEEVEARLRERTREWARPTLVEEAGEHFEALVFSLSGETYAIGSEHIAEVVPFKQFTPLPNTPAWVMGIVDVRGRVISVVDLRILFELPLSALADRNSLVILQDQEMEFALLIDKVLGITRLRRDALQREVANLAGIRATYLLGITTGQWTVLDGSRLLGDPAMRIIID